jgi:hypothetical protein
MLQLTDSADTLPPGTVAHSISLKPTALKLYIERYPTTPYSTPFALLFGPLDTFNLPKNPNQPLWWVFLIGRNVVAEKHMSMNVNDMNELRLRRQRSADQKRQLADSLQTCCICYEEAPRENGVACGQNGDGAHFTCNMCFERHVREEASEANFHRFVDQKGRICCVDRGNGCLQRYADPAISRCISVDTHALWMRARDHLAEQRGRTATITELGQQEAPAATAADAEQQRLRQKRLEDTRLNELEICNRLRLPNGTFNAFQCPVCHVGPVEHAFCNNLMTHQGEARGRATRIDNACANCGYFAADISGWERWDGRFQRETSDVSSIRGNTLMPGLLYLWRHIRFHATNTVSMFINTLRAGARRGLVGLCAEWGSILAVGVLCAFLAFLAARVGFLGDLAAWGFNIRQHMALKEIFDLDRLLGWLLDLFGWGFSASQQVVLLIPWVLGYLGGWALATIHLFAYVGGWGFTTGQKVVSPIAGLIYDLGCWFCITTSNIALQIMPLLAELGGWSFSAGQQVVLLIPWVLGYLGGWAMTTMQLLASLGGGGFTTVQQVASPIAGFIYDLGGWFYSTTRDIAFQMMPLLAELRGWSFSAGQQVVALIPRVLGYLGDWASAAMQLLVYLGGLGFTACRYIALGAWAAAAPILQWLLNQTSALCASLSRALATA